jgi:predicted Zn-dependent peptidase
LSNEVIPDEEIIKTKNILATSIASRNQYMNYIAERISFYKIFLNDASKINSEIDNYLNITKEEITEIVRKYIIKNNRIVLYYLPKENLSAGLPDE